jgi:hypothetical protein
MMTRSLVAAVRRGDLGRAQAGGRLHRSDGWFARRARGEEGRRDLTPILDPTVLHRLSQGGNGLSASVAVVILVVLNVALIAKILLRSPNVSSRHDAVRVLDLVVIPLLVMFVVFIAIMVERLGVLA